MSSSLKPITLYSHASGPNPWKTAIVLEELGIPYTTKFMDFGVIKKQPYTDLNPNGRVPAIEDPNTSTNLWESGAINYYLTDTYDKEGKISYKSSPEKYQVMTWLMFQMSGQGPYYGQGAWFMRFHHEKLPSAIERYQKEIERIVMVIDSHLAAKQGNKKCLVGEKVTYADLAFITWGANSAAMLGEKGEETIAKHSHYKAWMDGLLERPAVKKVLSEKAEAMKKGH